VEADHRDYKRRHKHWTNCSDYFPASRAKLIPLVDPVALADETVITTARNRTREAFGK
jgi:hypothetical protein